jgi:oxaloacetate decarboxylase beta subunit
VKEYEPVLLLPIGFGCLLANLPLTGMNESGGIFGLLYEAGISTELFPLLIFVGVGAMIDFSPLLSQPHLVLLGAAGQFGIYGTLLLATLIGFPINEAASIGVIGAIDGPTSIFVTTQLAPHLLAPVAVAAYSYMSLVPIIQPPLMRLLTTRKERKIRMEYTPRPVSRRARVLFPILVTLVIGLLVPKAAPLIAMLMLGNLLRESLVVERLSKSAQNEIANVSTLFLGVPSGSTMNASVSEPGHPADPGNGPAGFVLDTVAGCWEGCQRVRAEDKSCSVRLESAPFPWQTCGKMAQEKTTITTADACHGPTLLAAGSVVAGAPAGLVSILENLL